MSIHLKLKVLGETVYLIGLARSDVRPLARARQEMLTDMPFKLHEMEGRNHSSGAWGAITYGGGGWTAEEQQMSTTYCLPRVTSLPLYQ